MKKIIILLLSFVFISTMAFAKQNKDIETVKESVRDIPVEWLTFQPRKIPFVPFKNIDYQKIYETPVNIKCYGGDGWIYNKNYVPYVPERYLYAKSNYSYNQFLKETKNTSANTCNYMEDSKLSGEKYSKDYDYAEWLWKKIRSDYKKVHGMYSKTIVDNNGNKQIIVWEDGGIVSIYEQRKLFYEYVKAENTIPNKYYKFLQNFRFDYPDVRVNNPHIEFIMPNYYAYNENILKVSVYKEDFSSKIDKEFDYAPEMQVENIEEYIARTELATKKKMRRAKHIYPRLNCMGPDGKLYAIISEYDRYFFAEPIKLPTVIQKIDKFMSEHHKPIRTIWSPLN